MGTLDLSFLTSWYDSKAGIVPGSATGAASAPSTADMDASVALALLGGSSTTTTSDTSSSSPAAPAAPTPPWAVTTSTSSNSTSSISPQTLALVQQVLDGGKLIDPNAAKLDAPSPDAKTTSNYRDLFALYQGLTALQGIAQEASGQVDKFQLQQLQQAFTSGMQQVQSFLSSKPFQGFQVVQSNELTKGLSSAAVPQETDTFTTAPIFSGAVNSEIPAFQGAVQFSVTATKLSGSQTTVNFDLSEMGSAPRTMANVITYLNGKLSDAGLTTRFQDVFTPGTAQTIQVGGQTVTLPDSADQYGLKIVGTSAEQLSFAAPTTDPAVYIGQTSGITAALTDGASTSSAPDAVQQLVKLDASATPTDGAAVNGQVFKQTLGSTVGAVQATATAPDGSVYVLANVTGAVGGQPIDGAQDVALIKYDSAGDVIFTRTLGAPDEAAGYALAVSADGSQVAVTGSTTDKLDPTTSTTGSTSTTTGAAPQGFVTVYDGEGEEQWTQQMTAVGGNGAGVQPNAVAFGSGGQVYVAGQVDGALPGGHSSGNVDGFLQAFHATSVPLNDGTTNVQWLVTPTYTSEFGTGGQNRATGVAVSGSSVYVSSMENGDAVVRQFDQSGTTLTAAATRDLGAVQGGSVAGVAINADGSIIVAGSTHNGALDGGTVTQAYTGGEQAFVASLSPGLQASASDRLTYLGAPTDLNATALTTSGGQVYLTGQVATGVQPGTGETHAFNAYAAAIDPTTGQVSWSQTYAGQEHEAAPTSIAVSQTGASVLDQLGLPSGALDYSASPQLVANTSVRAGDKFYVQTGGGAPMAVTIDANDTYATLAQKIQKASDYYLTATVLPGTSGATLSLAPAFAGQQGQLIAGPPGSAALAALGMKEAVITSTAGQETMAAPTVTSGSLPATSSIKNGYSLLLPSTLNLSDPASVKAAFDALSSAIGTVQGIYQDMTTPPSTASSASSGTVPAYLTDEISNYQAALDRLTGGS